MKVRRYPEPPGEARKSPISSGDADEHRERAVDLEHGLVVEPPDGCAHALARDGQYLVDLHLRDAAQAVLGRGIDRLPQWLRWPANNRLYRYPPFARRIERPVLSARDRGQIAERLRDDTNRFREFAGRDFARWSV